MLTELAGIVDVLMIANRVCVRPMFEWTFRSLTGGYIRSRTGVLVETKPLPDRPEAGYLFVLGNSNPDNPALSVGKSICRYRHRDAQVFLLAEAASRYIAEFGDKHAALTTHWENSALQRERQIAFQAGSALAVQDGSIVTCAGMGATVDITLALIGRHVSAAIRNTVADILLHERIRDFSTQQPYSGTRGSQTGDAELDECIELMSANIEEPLPINELVRLLGYFQPLTGTQIPHLPGYDAEHLLPRAAAGEGQQSAFEYDDECARDWFGLWFWQRISRAYTKLSSGLPRSRCVSSGGRLRNDP